MPGDLQVSDSHTALEQDAQDRLGLVAEQPDVLSGALDAHDRQAGECVIAQGHGAAEADPLAGDARLQLLRRGVGDHDATVNDHDALGERVGLFQVMGGQHNRLASAGSRAHAGQEGAPRLDVHAHGGLIEEEHLGVAADRQREVEPLTLPARKPHDALVRDLLKPRQARTSARAAGTDSTSGTDGRSRGPSAHPSRPTPAA